jgi:hypothetical protein
MNELVFKVIQEPDGGYAWNAISVNKTDDQQHAQFVSSRMPFKRAI